MYELIDATMEDKELLIKFKLDTIFNSSRNISEEEKNKIINYVKNYIPSNIEYFKLISINDKSVGCFSLKPYEDGFMIEEIYLLESYRNKGIGSDIISSTLKNNKKPIYLWVYKDNIKAIKLYERFGFKIIDETETRYLMNHN